MSLLRSSLRWMVMYHVVVSEPWHSSLLNESLATEDKSRQMNVTLILNAHKEVRLVLHE